MAKLTYGLMISLDGFIADPTAYFDDESLAFINDEMRQAGTEIYGRRMYETMVYWETQDSAGPGHVSEFARLWQGLDKLVISSTLERPSSARTTIVREFRPDDIRQLKASSARNLSVSGPTLAAGFIAAGLVDEYALYHLPVVLGTGKPVFQPSAAPLDLTEERAFPTGMVFRRYVPRA
jgi:dihydrofolate reductase